MDVIAGWAKLENFLSHLFVRMLGVNPTPAAAIYAALKAEAARDSALRTLAEFSLQPADEEVFSVLLELYDTAGKLRHKVAHWIWGHTDDIPDAVLLCDPRVYTKWLVERAEHIARYRVNEKVPPRLDREKILVYTEQDFYEVTELILQITLLMIRFDSHLLTGVKNTQPVERARRFDELTNEPLIRERMARLRAGRRRNQEAQQ